MEEYHYETKIPKERIAVLIGAKGENKKKIEKELNARLVIDSDEGDVIIKGYDSFNLLIGQNIVKAIGRGINPNVALRLLEEDAVLETIDITDFSGRSKNKLIRIRGRAIGTDGKSRERIEELTNTNIAIYGKTITIIGDYEGVALARKAIESLLSGSRHTTIYQWLEKQTKEQRRSFY